MTDQTSEPRPGRWPWIAGGAAALLVLLLLLLPGGPGPSEIAPSQTGNGAPTSAREDDCRRQLAATLDGLRPERLGVSVGIDAMTEDLNIWWTGCRPADGAVAPPDELDAVRKLLGADAARRAAADQFGPRDVGHIRTALLFRAIAQDIRQASERDVARAVAVFDFVVRQVALARDEQSSPALTPFEVLLFGRGTASDRAWVFAGILRSLGLDCILLRPRDAANSRAAWLVGVIVQGEGVYLFDPALGLPIPAREQDANSPLVTRPATLADVREDDGLLRQLDVPGGPAYALTADELNRVEVQVIGDSCLWSPRMAEVQAVLPAEHAATLSEPLTGESGAGADAGLLSRVEAAGGGGGGLWAADDLTGWDYPESRSEAFYAAGGDRSETLRQQFPILSGHRIVKTRPDGKGGEIFVEVEADRPLRYVRAMHLMRDFKAALVGYGPVRALRDPNVSGDAIYWIGVCQNESGNYPAAVNTLKQYLRDNLVGTWRAPARYVLALSEAAQGHYVEAAAALSAEPGGTPSPGESFLIRRWRSLAERSTSETESRPSERK